MNFSARLSLLAVLLTGCPGNIFIIQGPDSGAHPKEDAGTTARDAGQTRDSGSISPDVGHTPGRDAQAALDLGFAEDAAEATDTGAIAADSGIRPDAGTVADAGQSGRDSGTSPDATAPPPPQGAPYANASEQQHGLARVLNLTGNYGVALTGGQLLASNASGGSALPRTTPVSSSGSIDIPAGANVHSAVLWYTGSIFMKPHDEGEGDYTTDVGGPLDGASDVQGNGITFSINGATHGPYDPVNRTPPNPSALGSQTQLSPEFYAPHFGTFTGVKESVWGNRIDVTSLMRGQTGHITIAVQPPERLDPNGNDASHNGGNPAGNTTYNLCSGGSSWSMLVIYESPSLPRTNLVLLDGTWARAWDYLFFHSGTWHRPKVRIDHAPIQHGAKLYIYAASSSPVATALPANPACSCGCGGAYTLKNVSGPYGRNNYFSDTLVDPPAARSDPLHRDRTNGPWYLHGGGLSAGIAGNDWTLFQSGLVYTEFPNLYEGENAPAADSTQPVTHEDDPDASHDTYAGHPWNGRGTVRYLGHGNANSTVEVALDDSKISVGETSSYVYLKGDQKDVWKPQQIVSVKYILFSTPVP